FPGAAPNDDASACMEDVDRDGYGDASPPDGVTAGSDCDDSDPAIPALGGCNLWCTDLDGDGFGNGADCVPSAADPGGGRVNNGGDCADNNAAIPPGAAANEPALCTIDADQDGYGDVDASTIAPGASDGTDCAD